MTLDPVNLIINNVHYIWPLTFSVSSQGKPSSAPQHAKWLHVLTDCITPVMQKGKGIPRWERKWPEVSMSSERAGDMTLGLPGQPIGSANCLMHVFCVQGP